MKNTRKYYKMAIAVLFVSIIQIICPIFSNMTYAETTSSGLEYEVEDDKVHITGYNSKVRKRSRNTKYN